MIKINTMKNIFAYLLLIVSIGLFAQDKTYQFLYDYQQKGELSPEVKKKNPSHITEMATEALNKVYEFEVLVNQNYSLVKILPRVNNNQSGNYLEILPEPSCLFIDLEKNELYEQYDNLYIKEIIQDFKFIPTKNKKAILGLEAREFKYEDEHKLHSIWLAKQNNLTVSPTYFQPKGYLVMLYHVFDKGMAKNGGNREFTYQLKEIKEIKSTDLSNQIPKKSILKKEFDDRKKVLMEENGVDFK